MNSYPSLKRGLSAVLTLLLIVAPLAYLMTRNRDALPSINIDPVVSAQPPKGNSLDWVMYGGSPSRNMANTTAKGLPVEWDVNKKKGIKWVADLGSKAYGGPTVAGGRVFIGTNNQNPRDKKWMNGKVPIDLGVVMCFTEATGKFEWQAVHPKLPGGQVVDGPRSGIRSEEHTSELQSRGLISYAV